MKKSLILSVLGLASAVSMGYSQGAIQFNSYVANGGSGILTTLSDGTTGLDSTFTAGLLYSLSPISDAATTSSLTASAPLNSSFTVAPNTAVFATAGATAGYFIGNNFSLSSGAPDGTVVYFEVIAYQTAAGSYANSTIRGHSAAFTGVLKATPNTPITMDNMAPFSVYSVTPVPEPTTLALAGFGGLASLVMLRRKQA